MKTTFIDSNVVVYHLLQNHPDHSPRCTALFIAIALGQEAGVIAPTVIFETVFTMSRVEKAPREKIRNGVARVLQLKHVACSEKDLLLTSLDLWVKESPLSFADCYHLVLAQHLGLSEIYTFDKKMNRYPGIARIEP